MLLLVFCSPCHYLAESRPVMVTRGECGHIDYYTGTTWPRRSWADMILINLLRFISCPCFHVLHNALANFRHSNQPQHAPAVCPGPTFDKYFCKYFKDTFSVSRDSITQHYTISRAMSQLSHLTRATLSSVTS